LPGQKRDRSIWVAGLVAIALFPAPARAAEMPSASFDLTPANPRAGQPIQLTSSSCDPDGRLWSQDWDLDGDGVYGDATGSTASATFASPGSHVIGLQVMSANGDIATQLSTVVVDAANAPPRPEQARLMSPFPVVTLGGRLERAGTGVNLFTVSAPLCAIVEVACRGRGCPLDSLTAHVGRGALRLRAVQRRFRAGNRLTVAVSKGGLVGKLTEFRFRRHRPPARTDSCLVAATGAGARCPSG
jgi:PKD domain